MKSKYDIRTDLALELKEEVVPPSGIIDGVLVDEKYYNKQALKITAVEVVNEKGSSLIRKPIGKYITIEAKYLSKNDDIYHKEIVKTLAKHLNKMIKELCNGNGKVKLLVAGLGNRNVTPDALGPLAVDNLEIDSSLSAIAPGVFGQTGMETASVIKGVISENKPDVLIVVDALAARSSKRLNQTIQLSNTGIQPGSGVGNNREEINKENMKVPVIAIGVPTVVDAATIVNDTLTDLLEALSLSYLISDINEREKYYFVKEVMQEELVDMYVTPKEVDETIRRIAYTISEAINLVQSGIKEEV